MEQAQHQLIRYGMTMVSMSNYAIDSSWVSGLPSSYSDKPKGISAYTGTAKRAIKLAAKIMKKKMLVFM